MNDLRHASRDKKGLLNVGGDILSYLFGTATQKQISTIHSAVKITYTSMISLKGKVKSMHEQLVNM